MPAQKQNTDDEGWKIAQAAFEAAGQLPPGAARLEALKKEGMKLTRKGTIEAVRDRWDEERRGSAEANETWTAVLIPCCSEQETDVVVLRPHSSFSGEAKTSPH
jgi:hypothetical protein